MATGRASEVERWLLTRDGAQHVLEIGDKGLRRELVWSVDGVQAATKRSSDERIVLTSEEHGALGVRLPAFVGPARRVTLYGGEVEAHAGTGGTDFDPESGSRAAAREEWIREHPHLHTARQTALAAGGVIVPLLLLWLLGQVVLPAVPWPAISLPDVPLPDLPDIPWPEIPWPHINLPSIPWPDLPDLPGWVKYVFPVVLAFLLARAEIRRRRTQDERKHTEQGQD